MKAFTVWIKKPTTIIIGGEAGKSIPIITAVLNSPQVIIDHENGTITITETK